jgi:hypothetical protein
MVNILNHLKAARDKAAFELGRLDAAISALSGSRSKSSGFKGTRRKMSASARRKISLAQKARWAKQNSNRRVASAKPRPMSTAGRRSVAKAQKARWAKWRANQGKRA